MAYGELWLGTTGVINTPVLWINKYLQEKITEVLKAQLGENESFGASLPLFPSTPSTIDDLTEYFAESTQGVAATWDRLIKMNRKGFPHIKCEQLLYYFYATGENPIEKMVMIQESVLRLMDRFDESAEEINNWCSNRVIRVTVPVTVENPTGFVDLENQFYFHNFKVYQLEETRDIIDFGTARTYGGNKIIIDFDYHQLPALTASDWQPEKLATKIVL
jgi:hypothetical protein